MEDEDYDSNVVVPQHHCHCNQREYNLRRNKRRSDRRRHQIIVSKSCSWLDLPHELVAAILHLLPIADLVTISAVCRTWCSHAAEAVSARPPLLLDSDRCEWVEVRSLGNWCLFIDGKTKCSMACSEPTRWGGRNNCIYLAAVGVEGRDLSVFPLDDNQVIHDGFSSLLFRFKWDIFKWPLPIWVSPSISGGPAIGDRLTK